MQQGSRAVRTFRRLMPAALGLCLITACQTTGETVRPGPVYSGWFIWDSERALGDLALQCMHMVLNHEEALADGKRRLTGVTRYITGPDDDIDFVEAELIYDPQSGRFEMWEHNATSDNFVSDGKFEGQFRVGSLFLDGVWESEGGGESGRLSMRRGADAPCRLAGDA